jgi:hypothetical protein
MPIAAVDGHEGALPIWTKGSGSDTMAARRGFLPTCSAHSKDNP